MTTYYHITRLEDYPYGIGYSDMDLFESLQVFSEGYSAADWQEPVFQLKDGGFADYQVNNCGFHLCSARLMEILSQNAINEDGLMFLKAQVRINESDSRQYNVLHLPLRFDVLDAGATLFADGDHVIKPVLSLHKIGEHKIFSYKTAMKHLIVHESVRQAILKAKCTGIGFFKAASRA